MANKNGRQLNAAKSVKNDEFYTLLEDVEKECDNYISHFKDKIIYCNCDNPLKSNFVKYFLKHFNEFGLRRLIATNYSCQDIFENSSPAFYLDVTAERNTLTVLNGGGDFRNEECVELLKQADIVITNPPFSLFREMVALLEKYNKQYLLIGNKNAIAYKEIFPLIMNNKMWLGYNSPSEFLTPDGNHTDLLNGLTRWFTNLYTKKCQELLSLTKAYNPAIYPTYDNYNAIEVEKVKDIPKDYPGLMGVPITFLDKFNPTQFEIVGAAMGWTASHATDEWKEMVGYKDIKSNSGIRSYAILRGVQKYHRILIRNKKLSDYRKY